MAVVPEHRREHADRRIGKDGGINGAEAAADLLRMTQLDRIIDIVKEPRTVLVSNEDRGIDRQVRFISQIVVRAGKLIENAKTSRKIRPS